MGKAERLLRKFDAIGYELRGIYPPEEQEQGQEQGQEQKQEPNTVVGKDTQTNSTSILSALRKKAEDQGVLIFDGIEKQSHKEDGLFRTRKDVVLSSREGELFLVSVSLDSHENIILIKDFNAKEESERTLMFVNNSIDHFSTIIKNGSSVMSLGLTGKQRRRFLRIVGKAEVDIEATKKLR